MSIVQRKRKRETEKETFHPKDHILTSFLPQRVFKTNFFMPDNSVVYNAEIAFNGNVIILIGKTKSLASKKTIEMLNSPDVNNERINVVAEHVFNCVDYIDSFILLGGSIVVVLCAKYDEVNWVYLYELKKFEILKTEDNSFQIEETKKLQLPKKIFSVNIAPNLCAATSSHYIALSAGSKYETNLLLIDCSTRLLLLKTIPIDNFGHGLVSNISFSGDCRKVIMGTVRSQLFNIDITEDKYEITDLDFLDQAELGWDGILVASISFEDTKSSEIFVITSHGIIYNTRTERCVNIKDMLSKEVYFFKCDVNHFNKCLYFYDNQNHALHVYNPFREVVLCSYSKKSIDYSLNSFGNEIVHFNRGNLVTVEKVFSKTCLPLTYLCRIAMFKHFSQNQLIQKKLDRYLEKLLFDGF